MAPRRAKSMTYRKRNESLDGEVEMDGSSRRAGMDNSSGAPGGRRRLDEDGSRKSLTTAPVSAGSPLTSNISDPMNKPTGGVSVPNQCFNLTKNIVGAGVLGLPAGVAAFGDNPTAILPALFLIAWMGGMAAYGFSLIGRLCSYTQTRSYGEAWNVSVSPSSGWIPTTASVMVSFSLILSYSMILSRTIPDLVAFIHPEANLSNIQGLSAITISVLLPLCLLKDLKSLAPFSLLGIFGMYYTCLAMAFRYIHGDYDEASATDRNDKGFLHILSDENQPEFGHRGATAVFSTDSLMLISMLSTAFSAHYNAPKFYWELKDANLPKFKTVVMFSFSGSVGLMAMVAVFGFLTFGGACQGLILNNYSTQDTLMTISRFAVTLSLVTSYPIAFSGLRDGVLELANIPRDQQSHQLLNSATIFLLLSTSCFALVVHDLRLVMALKGATAGTANMYFFPSLMMYRYCQKQTELLKKKKEFVEPEQQALVRSLQQELPWIVGNGSLALVLGCIGTYRALRT